MTRTERKKLRTAIADYMQSEGCACCRNIKAHKEHEEALAKLLKVPKYKDQSGYDFNKFATTPINLKGVS